MSQRKTQEKSKGIPLDDQERITFEFGTKHITLILTNYTEIDADDITKIHYHNIVGELLTCSTALNRIGNMKADANEVLAKMKLDFDIFEAQKDEDMRKALEFSKADAKGNITIKTPSNPEVEAAIKRSPEYKVKRKSIIEAQKNVDILDSLYWSMKSKDDKLNKITDKLRPEELEKDLLEESVNGIQIKVRNNLIN